MSLLDTASLIVTPNGYKEGKLYSVIPSDGSGDLSVTRATTATRVNSQGLVELVPYNLLTYSNTFSNAAWTKTNTTVTSGQSGYDGSTNAWKLQATATNNCEVDQSFSESETKTFSIYAKAGNVNFVAISVFGAGYGWYNLSNGTLGSSGGTFVSRNIESVGNGWYRCSIVTNVAASGVAVYVCNADNSIATSVGSNIFIQNSQFEGGSVPTTYQKTETRLNIPRLDYSNGTCPSILVEPQRTNLVTWSSSFDNAAWIKLNGSVTANATTSPDGTTNADSFIPNTTSGLHALRSNNFNQSSTASHSWFLKANGYSKIAVRESDLPVGNYASFDLSTGTLISTSQSGIIENVGNGWYRCTLVDTATGAGAQTSIFVLPDSYTTGNPLIAWSGDGIKGVYAYGAQAELGSYPTSYIPTTSASVTRNADVISKTGISSLIGQTEGTLFQDIYIDDILNAGSYYSFLAIGTTGNLMFMTFYPDGRIQFAMFNGNVLQVNIDAPSYGLTTGRHKMAVAYKNNDFAFYCDGNLVGTANSGSVPATSKIDLTDTIGGKQRYNAAALWTTRLTNTQLAQLTTI